VLLWVSPTLAGDWFSIFMRFDPFLLPLLHEFFCVSFVLVCSKVTLTHVYIHAQGCVLVGLA
jgi:hypothetical protein